MVVFLFDEHGERDRALPAVRDGSAFSQGRRYGARTKCRYLAPPRALRTTRTLLHLRRSCRTQGVLDRPRSAGGVGRSIRRLATDTSHLGATRMAATQRRHPSDKSIGGSTPHPAGTSCTRGTPTGWKNAGCERGNGASARRRHRRRHRGLRRPARRVPNWLRSSFWAWVRDAVTQYRSYSDRSGRVAMLDTDLAEQMCQTLQSRFPTCVPVLSALIPARSN